MLFAALLDIFQQSYIIIVLCNYGYTCIAIKHLKGEDCLCKMKEQMMTLKLEVNLFVEEGINKLLNHNLHAALIYNFCQ